MTLDAFLNSGEMTAAKLSQLTKLSPASITRIRKGRQNIGIDVARSIMEATGGKVTPNDLAFCRERDAA